jgi:pyruvate kinase
MALMRDVFPIDFDSRGLATREAARAALKQLFDDGLLAEGDRVVSTGGDHMEHRGATNTMRLLQVGTDGHAEGLGEL